jgi:hypothetical protein
MRWPGHAAHLSTDGIQSNIDRRKAIDPIANIGPDGQQRRVRLGIVVLVGTALLAAVLFGLGAPRGWRLVLFPPLWVGLLGVFQAREKT